jgi:hypothetical protein
MAGQQGGPMPVYVFRVVNHKNSDLSWPKECQDAGQAQAHATHVAAELARDETYHGCQLEVIDEHGGAVGRVPVVRT